MMHEDMVTAAMNAASKARAALSAHDDKRVALAAALKTAEAWANGLSRLADKVYTQVVDVAAEMQRMEQVA